MDILTLLEHLANNAHYYPTINQWVNGQPEHIKSAFLTNNANQLKSQLGDTSNLADKSHVVQITL